MSTRVLLVEDQEAVRKIIEDILTTEGYTVISASGGQEGWGMLEAGEKVDAIISDVQMPCGNGDVLLLRVRNDQRFSATPFILISGNPKLHGSLEAVVQEAGAELLAKPFSRKTLVELLEKMNLAPRQSKR